jgi:UDPglucose--hexose-1-phosphate uridylyltransferase
MSERRDNPFIERETVIIAPERSKRYSEFKPEQIINSSSKNCPFCQGHEKETKNELLSYRFPNSNQNKQGWWVRVIPNKFPALKLNTLKIESKHNIYTSHSGFGVCELILTPYHNKDFGNSKFDSKHNLTKDVLWAFNQRKKFLHKKFPNLVYLHLFKNRGKEAGASIHHPHLQIIGNEHIPKRIGDELNTALRFVKRYNQCLYCTYIEYELKNRDRIIEENDTFVALTPYAPRYPYEVMILPKYHQHNFYFEETKDDFKKMEDLSTIIRNVFKRLNKLLNNPPYNWWIHDSPLNKKTEFYHWHIEIIPKIVTEGGYEKGTEEYINIVSPEEAGKQLRNISI